MTLVRIDTTEDAAGDETEDRTETPVAGAIFEPERTLERTSNDQAPVLVPASWNIPGVRELDSDDLIVEGDTTDDAFDPDTAVTWQVIGAGVVWLDRTKVPVERVTDV